MWKVEPDGHPEGPGKVGEDVLLITGIDFVDDGEIVEIFADVELATLVEVLEVFEDDKSAVEDARVDVLNPVEEL